MKRTIMFVGAILASAGLVLGGLAWAPSGAEKNRPRKMHISFVSADSPKTSVPWVSLS